jgi:hypothetical protein
MRGLSRSSSKNENPMKGILTGPVASVNEKVKKCFAARELGVGRDDPAHREQERKPRCV